MKTSFKEKRSDREGVGALNKVVWLGSYIFVKNDVVILNKLNIYETIYPAHTNTCWPLFVWRIFQ